MSSGYLLFVALVVFVFVTQLIRLPAALTRLLTSLDIAEGPNPSRAPADVEAPVIADAA